MHPASVKASGVGAGYMVDLLKLAREKSERLISEAEETSALVESAEYFFREIPNHRKLISAEFGNLDDFLTDANTVVGCIKKLNEKKIEELQKLSEFIKTGEMLLGLDADEDLSHENISARLDGKSSNKLSDGDQLHWLTFGRKKGNDDRVAED